MMTEPIKILGIVGSLRKDSYNKFLMQATSELLPADSTLEVFYLHDVPPFNQDLENQPPQAVQLFKEKIRGADAIVIVSPEYNYSVPGVLKNAIDWASRPHSDNAFDGKPVAIMSASIGRLGGARMQYHLRQSFVYLNMYPINLPEFTLPNAKEHFDENGKLIDEETRQRIRELLIALVKWTRKLEGKT
jgi:chromate reductase